MIHVTRLDHMPMVVNAELIATVESTPDTMLTLVDGHRILVTDRVDEIVARILEYQRQVRCTTRVLTTVTTEREDLGKG